MAIDIPFTGQFGNQTTVYCVAKILAEKYQQDYTPPTPYWQKKDGSPVRYACGVPFISEPKPSYGRAVSGPTQHWQSLHWVPMDSFERDRPIHVVGYCQRYELLAPYKDKIRNEWLAVKPKVVIQSPESTPETVYIHVRRTDYVGDNLNPDQQGIAHTIPEYMACLKEFPEAKKAVIVTDDPRDPFIPALRSAIAAEVKDKVCTSQSASWDLDWLTLYSARWVIMSQSTFSWWACWLSPHVEKAVCPVSPESLWGRGVGLIGPPTSRGDYPNLLPTDDHRFKWVTT